MLANLITVNLQIVTNTCEDSDPAACHSFASLGDIHSPQQATLGINLYPSCHPPNQLDFRQQQGDLLSFPLLAFYFYYVSL